MIDNLTLIYLQKIWYDDWKLSSGFLYLLIKWIGIHLPAAQKCLLKMQFLGDWNF